MDERPTRQPDPSEPPEDFADTGAEARPQNPYRIPQLPPESEHGETGGSSYERPVQKGEVPATDVWDNPFRGGATAGAEGGPHTPWGAPVPGTASPAGKGPADPMAFEDGWDTGTPWGAPVPGDEPPTCAFGSVGAFDETSGSDGGRGNAADAWGASSMSSQSETGDHSDAWDTDRSMPSGAGEGSGAEDTWGAASDDHDTGDARNSGSGPHEAASTWGVSGTEDAWGAGSTGEADGAVETWSTHSEAWDTEGSAGPGALDESGAGHTWGSPGAGHGLWGTGAGDAWDEIGRAHV